MGGGGGGSVQTQGLGSLRPLDPGSAHGLPRWIQGAGFTTPSVLSIYVLPTGSKERGVLGAGSTPVAILPSCQDMKTSAL